MSELGKWIAGAGVVLVAVGVLLWVLGRAGFRGLPGDIRYESENVRIYVPVVTMLVLSAFLSALLWIVRWLGRR